MQNQIRKIKTILKEAQIEEFEAETSFILDIGLNLSPVEILTKEIPDSLLEKGVEIALKRAKTKKPLAQLVGKVKFCGNLFFVDENVLIPRDETELLVEICKKYINEKSQILDLCTGSGVIGLSLKKSSNCIATLSDISEKALDVAKKNAQALCLEVQIVKSDLFENICGKFDLIVSNPPYIAQKDFEDLQQEVRLYEPCLALLAKDDLGIWFYEKIIEDAKRFLKENAVLAFEVGIFQAQKVRNLLEEKNFKNIEIFKDISGIERVVLGQNG